MDEIDTNRLALLYDRMFQLTRSGQSMMFTFPSTDFLDDLVDYIFSFMIGYCLVYVLARPTRPFEALDEGLLSHFSPKLIIYLNNNLIVLRVVATLRSRSQFCQRTLFPDSIVTTNIQTNTPSWLRKVKDVRSH